VRHECLLPRNRCHVLSLARRPYVVLNRRMILLRHSYTRSYLPCTEICATTSGVRPELDHKSRSTRGSNAGSNRVQVFIVLNRTIMSSACNYIVNLHCFSRLIV
jgi:hypothetical protein